MCALSRTPFCFVCIWWSERCWRRGTGRSRRIGRRWYGLLSLKFLDGDSPRAISSHWAPPIKKDASTCSGLSGLSATKSEDINETSPDFSQRARNTTGYHGEVVRREELAHPPADNSSLTQRSGQEVLRRSAKLFSARQLSYEERLLRMPL